MRTDLTICILSAVESPLPECLKAVEAQWGGPYSTVHINGAFPMHHAFNEMVRYADSRFLVQVDGDVVLAPWAVRSLYTFIRCTPLVYMAWGQLWESYDDGLRAGGSVRIWRRWPLRLFRFRDRRCVDRDLHSRIRWTGMRRLEVPAGWRFGTHLPRQTAFARFSKAKGDALKWIHLGRFDLHEAFKQRLQDKPATDTYPERLGLYAASLSTDGHRSKNLQTDWLEYHQLCASFSQDPIFYTGAPSSRWL